MSTCPHHDRVVRMVPACELQKLADATLTVVGAFASHVECIVILIDRADHEHMTLGAEIDPRVVLRALEHHAGKLRAGLAELERR